MNFMTRACGKKKARIGTTRVIVVSNISTAEKNQTLPREEDVTMTRSGERCLAKGRPMKGRRAKSKRGV